MLVDEDRGSVRLLFIEFWAGPHRGVFAGGNSECATVNACDSSAKECGCRAGCVGGSDRGVVVGEEIRGRWKIVAEIGRAHV